MRYMHIPTHHTNAGDLGLTPGLGRSPGEGKGYPLQYSGLENSMNCIAREVAEPGTTERLSLSRSRRKEGCGEMM